MVIKMLPLTSVTTVCTEKQFAKIVEETPKLRYIPYIYVTNKLKRNEKCAFSTTGILPPKCIAVIPHDEDINIGYMLFLLNSYPTQYEMFGHKINVLTHVTLNKKKLSSLNIPIIDKEEQRYYNVARLLKDKAEDLMNNPNTDKHMKELSLGLFSNLCDSLAIELYYEEYLKKNGIEIFKYWKENVDENWDCNNIEKFFHSLVDQSSELRNQLMKLRMIPTD